MSAPGAPGRAGSLTARAGGASVALSYGARLGLVTLAGGLLRAVLLAAQPLGYDEDFTAAAVHRPIGDMLAVLSRDSAPPLFYLLEHLAAPAGSPIWALRIVPALAGTALIPLAAALARRAGGNAAGLWAATFAAVLPATVLASENARMYALAGALVLAALLLLWRATESPGLGRWAAWTAVAALAAWTDYFAVVALAGIVVAVALLRPSRRALASAILGLALACLSLVPWLVYARAQLAHAGGGFWVPPLGVASVVGTLAQLFAGPPVWAGAPWRDALVAAQIVAVGAGSAALAALVWRRAALAPAGRRAAVVCLTAALAGIGVLFLVSLWRPLFEARYASVAWLPLLSLAGAGLSLVPRRAALLLLGAVALPSLALAAVPSRPDTAALLPAIEAQARPGDLVVASPSQYLPLLDEGGPELRSRLHVLSATDLPWYFGTAAYAPGAVVHAVPAGVVAAHGRVLEVSEGGAPLGPLPAGYRQASQTCAGGVCLTVYEATAPRAP